MSTHSKTLPTPPLALNRNQRVNPNTFQLQYFIQDPSVEISDSSVSFLETLSLEGQIENGPKDREIEIFGESAILDDGIFEIVENLIILSTKQVNVLDSMHTYTVARIVLNMYKRLFKKIMATDIDSNGESEFDFKERWNGPLKIYPRAYKDIINSSYTSIDNYIDFGFTDDMAVCRSFDVVAHEVGHAVFQALRYPFGGEIDPSNDSSEINEAFADITAIFALLNSQKVCKIIIDQTNGDLRSYKNFIPKIGEQFAKERDNFETDFIRNLCDVFNHIKEYSNSADPHVSSLLFTGGIYEFILRIFNKRREKTLLEFSHEILELNNELANQLCEIVKNVSLVVTTAFYNERESINISLNILGIAIRSVLETNNSIDEYYLPIFNSIFAEFNQFNQNETPQ